MRKLNIFKKAALILTVAAAGLVFNASVANAIPYDGDNTPNSPVPAFNVYTGVPSVGNEADFLRARVPTAASGDTTTQYVDPLNATCAKGQRIQMRIYVHNGASVDGNQGGSGPSVAHGTQVKVNLPTNQATSFNPSATISSTNAGTVNDGVTINCNGKSVKLKYIPGSASQYSIGTGAVPLSDNILTSGVPIRSQGVAGDVWGCWNERVYVILSVEVEEVPPPPEEKPVSYSCDLFTIFADKDRTVKITDFKGSSKNATVKNAVVDWGDNTDKLTVNAPSEAIGKTHQYKADGTYNVTAVLTFTTWDNKTVTAGGTGTACAQQVTFSSTQPPKVVPPTTPPSTPPTKLVNTGPGEVAGLFAATTVAGSLIWRRILGRRLGDI